jgi:Uma2 family endonuclease
MIDAVGPIKIRARGAATAAVGEARVLLTNVAWPLYQAIAGARGDRSIPRLTYVDGELELMSPSFRHETLARRLGTFVLMLARGLGRPCLDAGSTRWERMGLDKGKEPDACFYLGHEPAVRGLREIDLEIHPPPDLAIEVEITHALTDALRVYAALGVPEVWRSDGESLRFLHLRDDGTFAEREVSRNFPMLRSWEALGRLMQADESDQAAWSVAVEAWARDELARRGGAQADT